MPYLTQCYKRTKNTCHITRRKASNISMIQALYSETLSIGKQHNDGVAAHEANICAIICKNRALKQKPQNIKIIVELISSEA